MDSVNNISYRRMQQEDLLEVTQIDLISFSLPWPSNSFRYELSDNLNARPWVAEASLNDGSKVIAAMTVLWVILDEVHIGTFAVHPDYRRQGIGAQLLNYALQNAVDEGATRAWLEVRRGNSPALELYQKMGFEWIDTRKKYYQDNGEDALILTKQL
jgi:ribosomal-protein-alanine N-acetyltransferase